MPDPHLGTPLGEVAENFPAPSQNLEHGSGDCTSTECGQTTCTQPLAGAEPHSTGLPPSPLDGCPTPISWQVVLREFREQIPLQTIEYASGPIHFRVWGNGPPLYFINGMGGTIDHFALLTYLLKSDFQCVIPEYPSVSTHGRRCFRLNASDLSDRVIALADHLGNRQFSLFATSLGSLVSWDLMARNQDRILRAVVAGGFAHRNLSLAERALIHVGKWLPIRLRSLPLSSLVHQGSHRPWFPPIDPTRWQYFTEIAGELPVQDLAWRGAVIRDHNLTSLLPGIRIPVLVLQGEGDGLVTGKCRDVLLQNLPHAQHEMLANSGHLPHITHPHRLGKSIRNFLTTGKPAS